ncbi:MAG: ricin-type beta-trefoil lectin domain protein [Rhodanobacter sp.]
MKAIQGFCCWFVVCLLGLFPLLASASDTPGSYTNYAFAPTVTGLDSVDFAITVNTDPGYQSNLYWSNQFDLVGAKGSGGYTGMQSNGGDPRMFLFSVWNATESKPGAKGSYCLRFGGEGVGQSCRMAHEWKQGHTYRFHVAFEGDRWLGVTVTDLTSHESFKLGSIRTAANQISPKGMVNWAEYFEWNEPDASCYDQPYTSADFALPSGNNGSAIATVASTKVSKSCAPYSVVSKSADGTVQRNAIGNSVRGAITGADHRCLAASNDSAHTSAISTQCKDGRNQAWVYALDKTLRLQNNRCLSVGDGKAASRAAIDVATCNAGPNQQWVLANAQLRNRSSGLCLTTPDKGESLTVDACQSAVNQRWVLPLIPPR